MAQNDENAIFEHQFLNGKLPEMEKWRTKMPSFFPKCFLFHPDFHPKIARKTTSERTANKRGMLLGKDGWR